MTEVKRENPPLHHHMQHREKCYLKTTLHVNIRYSHWQQSLILQKKCFSEQNRYQPRDTLQSKLMMQRTDGQTDR